MLSVGKLLKDFEEGRVALSPDFAKELRNYSESDIVLAVPTEDGTRLIVMPEKKATELYDSSVKEIRRGVGY